MLEYFKQLIHIALVYGYDFLPVSTLEIRFEPCHEKINILHMRKQRRRSASR